MPRRKRPFLCWHFFNKTCWQSRHEAKTRTAKRGLAWPGQHSKRGVELTHRPFGPKKGVGRVLGLARFIPCQPGVGSPARAARSALDLQGQHRWGPMNATVGKARPVEWRPVLARGPEPHRIEPHRHTKGLGFRFRVSTDVWP